MAPRCSLLIPVWHYHLMLGKLPVLGVLLIGIRTGQGPTVLAAGADGGCLDICLSFLFSFSPSLSLGDGPIQTEMLSLRAVKPKTKKQPFNVKCLFFFLFFFFVFFFCLVLYSL